MRPGEARSGDFDRRYPRKFLQGAVGSEAADHYPPFSHTGKLVIGKQDLSLIGIVFDGKPATEDHFRVQPVFKGRPVRETAQGFFQAGLIGHRNEGAAVLYIF
ncbi:hypothetical protein D9M68_938470 [compost metagenome]